MHNREIIYYIIFQDIFRRNRRHRRRPCHHPNSLDTHRCRSRSGRRSERDAVGIAHIEAVAVDVTIRPHTTRIVIDTGVRRAVEIVHTAADTGDVVDVARGIHPNRVVRITGKRRAKPPAIKKIKSDRRNL